MRFLEIDKLSQKLAIILLISCSQIASAKVILLTCDLFNGDHKKWPADLSIDTENQTASAKTLNRANELITSVGKLYSDGSHYWFTYNASSGYSEKYQVDRNDLSVIYTGNFSGVITKSIGECKIVEKEQPKI